MKGSDGSCTHICVNAWVRTGTTVLSRYCLASALFSLLAESDMVGDLQRRMGRSAGSCFSATTYGEMRAQCHKTLDFPRDQQLCSTPKSSQTPANENRSAASRVVQGNARSPKNGSYPRRLGTLFATPLEAHPNWRAPRCVWVSSRTSGAIRPRARHQCEIWGPKTA